MSHMKGLKPIPNNIWNLILILLMVADIVLAITADQYTTRKVAEINNVRDASIFIQEDLSFEEGTELAETISPYISNASQMIELYDENVDPLLKLQFNSDSISTDGLQNYPDVVEYMKSREEGQTSFALGDTTQSVYFKWTQNSRNETRLIVVYSNIIEVPGIWFFHMLCIGMIVITFVMLTIMTIRSSNEKIRRFVTMTRTSDAIWTD